MGLPQFLIDAVVVMVIIVKFTLDVELSRASAGHVAAAFLTIDTIIRIITGTPNISEIRNEFLHLKQHS